MTEEFPYFKNHMSNDLKEACNKAENGEYFIEIDRRQGGELSNV